jgi:spore coat polysaccharide biosynthesis protein SpsF (cytidylyltransferase family)
MTEEALHRAAALAHDPYDREHVTSFIRAHGDLFHIADVNAPASLVRSSLRLSVDTREDLDRVRELFFRTQSDDPSLAAIIAAAGPREPLYNAVMRGTSVRQEVA